MARRSITFGVEARDRMSREHFGGVSSSRSKAVTLTRWVKDSKYQLDLTVEMSDGGEPALVVAQEDGTTHRILFSLHN